MKKYDSVKGVPPFHYYLREITQFADFETPQEEHITYVSEDKEELVKFCKDNNLNYQNGTAWQTHFIEYRSE